MERLRQIISYINEQLTGLSVSQRLAIGLCAALVAFSILWLLQWSTTPEMMPLVKYNFTYDELEEAEETLKSNNIRYDIRGNRIYVQDVNRHNALRLLHSSGALPEGSLFDMESVVTNDNPFQSPEARSYAQNYARGNELAKILVTSPYVKQASVIINPKTKRRLGGSSDVPTASVTVTLASNIEMTSHMVESFAKLVAGAVGGLKPHHVYITDARTLRSYSVPNPTDAASFDYLRLVKDREEHLHKKILDTLADIPSVRVAVSIELDTSKRITQIITHDKPTPKKEVTQSNESNSSKKPAEPGLQANLGTAVTDTQAGRSSLKEETVLENFEPKLSKNETIETMAYATKLVTASIRIPRSYVAGIFNARFPDKGDPKENDTDYIAVKEELVLQVKNSVEKVVMAKSPDDVSVDIYSDMEWNSEGGQWSRTPVGVTAIIPNSNSMDPMGLVRTYGPGVGLGLLALMSMSMMTRIAKKATPPHQPAKRKAKVEEEDIEEPILTIESHPVGQANASESMLVGREVDDETLRYQELGTEVSRMVDEDPENAAQLLRRWIDES